jgi:hypothetical protein
MSASLHVTPISAIRNGDGLITILPEICITFREGTPIFDYVKELIGTWEYYVSPTILVPGGIATVNVSTIDSFGNISSTEIQSACSVYIYGWVPGDPEWWEGQCVAIFRATAPGITATDILRCMVHIQLKIGEEEVADLTVMQDVRLGDKVESESTNGENGGS